jgi:hypothetical protein
MLENILGGEGGRTRDSVCYRILLMAGWNICSWSRTGVGDLYALTALFPLSKVGLVALFTFTQSGMITALINSCIDMPRSSASVCSSSKLSSRRDSMNFAKWTPKEWEGLARTTHDIKILRRKVGIIFTQMSENSYTGMSMSPDRTQLHKTKTDSKDRTG